jgi:inosine-uridine nucleoside N-ribohydrolase
LYRFIVLAIFWLTTGIISGQTRTKILLDTDIGTDIDDAWALAFVALSPELDTVAVTITDADTPARAKVACKLLQRAGRTDIPVSVGRQTPTPKERFDHQFTWAEDFTAYKPIAEPAAQTIVRMARKYPGELVLLAVGPLQNVADALRLEPQLGKYLKRVVLMSGNIYGRAGGEKVIPEWNVVVATQDSQLVYGAGLPLTIVPLDSTTHVKLADEERERVRKRASPVTHAVESLYRLWLTGPQSRMTLHDQLAVAEAARPGEFFGKKETLPLVVDDKGYTVINKASGKSTVVCLEPKRDAFLNYYLSVLTR